MKRSWIVGLGILVAATLSLLVWAQGEMSEEDAATATQYFEEVMAAPYTDWAFEPGVPEGYYVGQAPHGRVLRSFINDISAEVIGTGAEAFPEGSILVKENHIPGDVDVDSMEGKAAIADFEPNLEAITYMVKVPGYNPEAGDWFWGKIQPDGTIDVAGKGAGCIGCHTQVADNDFVFDAALGN